MARAYQDAHVLDNLSSSVKSLQSLTAELSKAKGLHDERITNLHRQNAEQAKKIEALEIRMSANEHNTAARILNAHAYHTHSLHSPLTPLHDVSTDRPISQFPKHERDIKTMGAGQVIQVLQALDVKSLGKSQAEKKGELRAQVGLPREADIASAVAAGGKETVANNTSAAAAAGQKEEAKAKVPGQRVLPKVAPGSTAEKVGKEGTAAAKGVSRPVGKQE